MKTRTTLIASTLIAASLVSGAAQAALFDRGGGLIYDDVLNVTWLQDANYAKTSGYDADGKMTWDQATTWTANLVYHDSVRNVDYSDWRLPTVVDTGLSGCIFASSVGGTDCGYNVQTVDTNTNPITVYSELAHMYYNNLGLKGYVGFNGFVQQDWGIFGNGTLNGSNTNSSGQNDVGPVKNLQAFIYWSGTEYAPATGGAWVFNIYEGSQNENGKLRADYAWAVRPGDVAAVPEAQTYALMLAGLGLVGAAVRRRKHAMA